MKKLYWFFGIVIIIYLGSITYRSYNFYSFVKLNWYGWSNGTFEHNEQLGFKLSANNIGYQIFPQNKQIPIYTGPLGNRVDSISFKKNEIPNPELLFIGDSHVFGDGCIAEQTFPYLTAKALNIPFVNSGVSSFGLCQMQSTLNYYINDFPLKKVIIQYSPWLGVRSINCFAPVYTGILAVPYFYEQNDSLILHSAPFKSKLVGTDIFKYRHTKKSVGEFLEFFIKKSLPVYTHTDYNMVLAKIKFFFGILPKPVEDDKRVEQVVYSQMIEACIKRGIKPYFLFLTIDWENKHENIRNFLDSKATIIDADEYLRSRLKENNEDNYFKAYGHWIGENNDFLADEHPNPKAHKLISKLIISSITPDSLAIQIP